MADDKDAELARRCAKGDAAAWASLVERYHRRFVQVAYRTVGDYDAAEDLALSLRAFEEMECDEIAAVMGVPLGTVLSWIHRGRVAPKKRWQRRGEAFARKCFAPAKDGGDNNALR